MRTLGHDVWQPDESAGPIVASVPHGGRRVPTPFTKEFAVSVDSLLSDWHTAELYDFLPRIGLPAVVNRLSRFVADPNRDPSGSTFGRLRSSVVAADCRGRPVYRSRLPATSIEKRLAVAHAPYHDTLDGLVTRASTVHGRAVVLDFHAFAAELDADIIIGDRHGTTAAPETVKAVEDALHDQGFRTARNLRWIGGWIVKKFGARDEVDAVQLELNARTYVEPSLLRGLPALPPYERDRFVDVRRRLERATAALATNLRQ